MISVLPFRSSLPFQVGCDFLQTFTVTSIGNAQLGFLAATAEMQLRVTPSDPTPLATITTTASDSGLITLGVTFPEPAGIAASGLGALEQFGPGTQLSTTLPTPSAVVVDVAALEALTTGPFMAGSIAFVEAGSGAYYAWSPGDTSTPNGGTIVAGASSTGNWLWAGTVTIEVSAASTQAYLSLDVGCYDVLVTLADGTVAKLLTGLVKPIQTVS